MVIESTYNAGIIGMNGISDQSGDVESAESRPDNESAERARAIAPLADGQGKNIDLTV